MSIRKPFSTSQIRSERGAETIETAVILLCLSLCISVLHGIGVEAALAFQMAGGGSQSSMGRPSETTDDAGVEPEPWPMPGD